MTIENWRNKGLGISVFNNQIFVMDSESDKKVLLILHGYACSSYDYYKILPELSKEYRVIIPDLICFGSSTKIIDRYFSITEQTDTIIELLKVLNVEDVTIFAHDYGALIASELISRKNSSLISFDINQLILSNYYLPQEYFIEEITDDLPKKSFTKNTTSLLATFSMFKKNRKKSLFHNDKISDEDFKNFWNLYTYNDGIDIIDFVANYEKEIKLFWERWIIGLKNTSIKTKIIWGKKDIFNTEEVIESFAANINNKELHFIENCGYFPMLEEPEKLTNFILNS